MTETARPPSTTLVRRLSIRLAWVMGFAFLVQTALVAWEYGRDTEELARTALDRDIDTIAAAAPARGRAIRETLPKDFRHRLSEFPDAYGAEVVDDAGAVLFGENAALFEGVAFAPQVHIDMTWNADRLRGAERRVLTRRLHDRATPMTVRVVHVGDPAHLWRAILLDELADHVAGPLAPITILVLGVTLFVVRRSLAPLERAAAAARDVDPRKSRFRLVEALPGPAPPAEVANFAQAMDKLLDRIDAVTEAQATFAGSIAHELRTPLSLLALELEGVPGEAAARARADVQAMARSVDHLLRIARLEALRFGPDDRVDLRAVAAEVVGRLAPLAIDAGRELAFADDGGATIAGSADAVFGALRNLVENALRISPKGGTVTVRVGPGSTVAVEDEGPGLPAGSGASLFGRFVQGDRAAQGSAGLGLAIVAKTMEIHHGSVEASDRPEGGARFRLRFPPLP